MQEEIYTQEKWKLFCFKHNIKTKDIANAIGTTEDNVRKQLKNESKLPTWARAMLYSESLLNNDTKFFDCGCFIDDNLLKRGKGSKCRLTKEEHIK